MPRAEGGLHRDLHYRDVGLRVHVEKRRPRAMVKAAVAVDGSSKALRLEQRLRALRHLRCARSSVAQPIKRLRKAGEIVDRLRLGGSGEHRATGFAMR